MTLVDLDDVGPLGRLQGVEVLDVRRVAREELLPLAGEHKPGPHGVNRRLLKGLATSGLLPKLFPRELGGTSTELIDALTLCRIREGLASEMTEAESALALQGLGTYPLVQSAVDEVRQRWVPEAATGRAVAAFALSEPKAGSDAASLECRADVHGTGYRLSGTKRWISNAPEADFYTIFARTGGDGPRGVTAFVVPGDAAGLDGRLLDMLAPHPVGELELDGVFVPSDHVLGVVGEGFKVAMRTLDLFRPSVGAFAVGMAQAALEAATKHANERVAFGQPIRSFQAVSHSLANMVTDVQASRLLVYAAARAYNEKDPDVTMLAAIAKLHATECAQKVVDAAVQIHGASGLQVGHPIEKLYREVRAPRIFEGTSEIQRNIIARRLYG